MHKGYKTQVFSSSGCVDTSLVNILHYICTTQSRCSQPRMDS